MAMLNNQMVIHTNPHYSQASPMLGSCCHGTNLMTRSPVSVEPGVIRLVPWQQHEPSIGEAWE